MEGDVISKPTSGSNSWFDLHDDSRPFSLLSLLLTFEMIGSTLRTVFESNRIRVSTQLTQLEQVNIPATAAVETVTVSATGDLTYQPVAGDIEYAGWWFHNGGTYAGLAMTVRFTDGTLEMNFGAVAPADNTQYNVTAFAALDAATTENLWGQLAQTKIDNTGWIIIDVTSLASGSFIFRHFQPSLVVT